MGTTATKPRSKEREAPPDASSVLGGKRVLGAEVKSNLEMHRLIEAGFPFQTIRQTACLFQLPERKLAEVVGISRSTFDRRRDRARLNADESERMYRVAHAFAAALAVFDSQEKAARWFDEPNRALASEKPLNMLRTEAGAREVENVLGRLVLGGYS